MLIAFGPEEGHKHGHDSSVEHDHSKSSQSDSNSKIDDTEDEGKISASDE